MKKQEEMIRIWKWYLTYSRTTFSAPIATRFISAAYNPYDETTCVWGEVVDENIKSNDTSKWKERTIVRVNTNEVINLSKCVFIGTVIHPTGLVWHVYEDTEVYEQPV